MSDEFKEKLRELTDPDLIKVNSPKLALNVTTVDKGVVAELKSKASSIIELDNIGTYSSGMKAMKLHDEILTLIDKL